MNNPIYTCSKRSLPGFAWLGCMAALVSSGVLAQVQDTTTVFSYDNMGNVKVITRPLGRSTSYLYDTLNRVSQENVVIGANSVITKRTYDGIDQTVSVSDPRNLVTAYTLDGLGNRSQLSSPDTQDSTFSFDDDGRVLTATDARGKITHYEYDAIGRLTLAQYQTGAASRFEYDGGPGGPTTEIGNLTRISDESGSTVFSHDLNGRVLTKTQVVDAKGASTTFTIQYLYGTSGGATGKLEGIVYPSGSVVSFQYDQNGRVTSVKLSQADPNGTGGKLPDVSLLTDITYTSTGTIRTWKWGNSTVPIYQRTYDLDGRLTSYPVDLSGTTRTVTYNSANLITSYRHAGSSNPAQYDQTFDYDTADRLVSYTIGGVTTGFIYDINGNRTQQTGPNVSYIYATASNRLTSASFEIPRSYSYDTAGNRISDGIYVYAYNDRSRLAQVRGSATLDMFYNAFGQRVLKSKAVGESYYVYDQEGHTVGEYGQESPTAVETVYLGDLPIAVLTPGKYFYLLADHLNAPVVITGYDGDVVWDWRNRDPFGNTAPVGSSTLPAYYNRFPGQVADAETGLFYNYFRDYDPKTGRYIQSDPIGLEGGINTYAYVSGNPLSFTDPNGLQAFSIPAPPLPAPGGYSPMSGRGSGANAMASDGGGRGRERETASQARSRSECPPNKPCPPCRTVSGRVVPVESIGYRPLDVIPESQIQHGVAGSHHNIFIAKQNPNNCQCFWAKQKYVLKPGQLPLGAVPVEAFIN